MTSCKRRSTPTQTRGKYTASSVVAGNNSCGCFMKIQKSQAYFAIYMCFLDVFSLSTLFSKTDCKLFCSFLLSFHVSDPATEQILGFGDTNFVQCD